MSVFDWLITVTNPAYSQMQVSGDWSPASSTCVDSDVCLTRRFWRFWTLKLCFVDDASFASSLLRFLLQSSDRRHGGAAGSFPAHWLREVWGVFSHLEGDEVLGRVRRYREYGWNEEILQGSVGHSRQVLPASIQLPDPSWRLVFDVCSLSHTTCSTKG